MRAACPEGAKDEIGYLAARRKLSRSDAAREYLRLAVPHRMAENQPAATEEAAPVQDGRRDEAETMEAINPHHAVWQRLVISPPDIAKLRNKRGFSPETIALCGFRSNTPDNRERLESLRDQYTIEALIAEGIYKHERFKEPRLAGQLVGWGRTGRKGPDGQEQWDETIQPIIIPYFNPEGVPFYLRPHKGGLRKPEDPFSDLNFEDPDSEDDDEERPCASYVYVPPGTAQLVAENDGLLILTEGEFKAVACRQARVPCIATPGTSFLKNANFRRRLTAVLDELGATNLVIIYDNETKDDPAFPNYKEDPHDRYDVQVWAEYAQIMLAPHMARIGGSCRIGWLPVEHMVDGKADFDSILGALVLSEGLTKGTVKARRVFLKTVADACEPGQFLNLFPDNAQRIIQWKVKQKRHKWMLLSGGSKESEKAIRFGEFDGDKPIDRELSQAFRGIIGCYYSRKTVSNEARSNLLKQLEAITERIDPIKAEVKDPSDIRLRVLIAKRDAIWERLRGMPERLSTFVLRCEYRLHEHNGDVARLVRILDSKDLKSRHPKLYRAEKTHLAGLKGFREWLLGTGSGVWHGGEKDLQGLCEDLDHQAYMRDIHEVIRIGFDKESKIWFMGDIAIGPKGEQILPDDKGIYWHNGDGYQLDTGDDARGATGFIQDVPLLTRPQTAKPLTPEELQARGGVAGIFKTLAQDCFDGIGGYDGWLALSLVMSYAVAPELVKQGGHPGLWFFGKLGEGKSTMMNWLMRIWGFRFLEGILLNNNLTDNALQRILAQYSCLPIFIDEARRETLTDTKLAIIRGSYQRQQPAKATADYTIKVRGVPPATTPMIGGEASSHDAATRSRFAQVNVAAIRRIGDGEARRQRMDVDCEHYHVIGRWMLTNRPKLTEAVLYYLDAWMTGETTRKAINKDRSRFLYGVAYATMAAVCSLLEIPEVDGFQFTASPEGLAKDHRPRTLTGYASFLLEYGAQAAQDVQDETFLNKFWEDVANWIETRKMKTRFFFIGQVGKTPSGNDSFHRCGINDDVPAGSALALMVEIGPAFSEYKDQYRHANGTPPRSRSTTYNSPWRRSPAGLRQPAANSIARA